MQHIKHYSLGLLVVFALLLGALVSAQPALAMTGDGTSAHSYQIATADDLIEFAEKVNSYDPSNPYSEAEERNAWAELRDDIDLEGTEWTRIGSSDINYNLEYIGTFDGNNHIISGLSINTSSTSDVYFGLFGAVGEGGTVRKLTVEGSITVESSDSYVRAGGVAGESDGTVSNCTNRVTIAASSDDIAYVGGVIGANAGNVSNCANEAAITMTADTAYIGGVIGFNGGSLTNCSNSGAVAGTGQTANGAYVGGIVGSNNHTESVMGSVENCYNTGTVTATGSNAVAGGVAGSNLKTVSSCYNTGTVTGTTAGGVVGANSYGTTPGTVTSCYNVGKVAASSEGTTIGGVVGANSNGSTSGTVNGCYFLVGTAASGVGDNSSTNVTNVASKTTEEFASGEVAWLLQDALGENDSTATQVWGQQLNGETSEDYPVLLAFVEDAPEVYRVAFEYDYDYEGTENAAYTNSGGTVSAPTEPKREGYAFGGWYSDKDFNTKWNFDTDTVTENINLYAKWTARIYPVTLITNGGTIESGDVTGYTYGVGVTLPVDVIRPGYTFGGWYAEADFSDGKVIEISTTDTGDKTFYAKWLSADTGVSRVIVSDQDAAINGNAISVTLPAGSSLPTAGDIQITAAEGATVSDLSTEDGGTTWTFTVTAEDGTTEMYTIQVTIAPLPAYTVTVAASSHGSVMANPTSAAAGETVTLTIAPETGYTLAGLNVADANGTAITVNGSETTYTFTMPDSAVTVTATFRLIEEPVDLTPTPDPDPSGPSTGESDGWESIADEITAADDGDSITIDMNGETEVPADIFEDVAGKDVDLVFDMGDGLSWSVNGQDVPTDANLTDLDLGVDLGTDGIPVDVINAITGEKDSVQITLAYDGDFGFTLTLTAPLGEDNAGYWANLYHYDEDTEAMNFEAAAEIDADGSVSLPLSHASQYAIVIDDHSHAATDVSEIFTDVPANHWAKAAIQYVYAGGLMTGVSDSEFAPEATTTRAMIVSMLARMENVTSAADAGFADVAASDWYATAVNWAAANGIVNGISDDTFAPNDPITREQLAAMLMNYAQWKGQDTSARADLSGYSDAPSTWASEAVQWAVAEGLLAGVTDDELQPQGQATRAQVAAIMQRFLEA